KDFLFQEKRVPTESGYYETFNRDNVTLVDIKESPIESVTEAGLRTSDGEYEFDVLIYATGFDSVTGILDRIDLRGTEGRSLREKWGEQGLTTYLGLAIAGFPNLFVANVPVFSASTPRAEWTGMWLRDCVSYMRDHAYTRIEPTTEAEDRWVEHHEELA